MFHPNKGSVQQQVSESVPPKPMKKRPALKAIPGPESSRPLKKHQKGLVTQLPLDQLDETNLHLRKYLWMYQIIGYCHGGMMPSKLGPSHDDNMGPGPFLMLDFSMNINVPPNIFIQKRAASAIKFIEEGQLSSKKASWNRHNEQRKLAAGQICHGLEGFCADNNLVHTAVSAELVSKDWMGDECLCDEDRQQNEEWRALLFSSGRITVLERDKPNLQVLEEKQPAWMHESIILGLVEDTMHSKINDPVQA
ncbi:hypothetical protein DACRYDRAFT_13498 [Dacryopinax primogenitus]|uniref:Uncharacterized protein n=1 Tax=Dacryopinax primogenitus (strain DJM 731) TaxID=1858805 RepID=M5GGH8_DACPD|nr:uncharacterized protein DACRYDRAFT_13498 [Dacryopinax primogenitus]EJU05513.1 hypothetical protein DACRYDRAFT_13498 [Dacryopinax primogenitus]